MLGRISRPVMVWRLPCEVCIQPRPRDHKRALASPGLHDSSARPRRLLPEDVAPSMITRLTPPFRLGAESIGKDRACGTFLVQIMGVARGVGTL